MASRVGEQDLRRRPVRPDAGDADIPQVEKEVEITEVEEEETEQQELPDVLDDDPMVVKGSRPTGPPKELPEGEDDWGMDDHDDWGGKTDQSEPRKETQVQRRRRVMRRTMTEAFIAFLVHLILLGFYVYVHVEDSSTQKRTNGKGFIGHDAFGGRWKFLTYINLWVQFVYFFLAFLCDIMPRSYAKLTLHKFCDFVFTTLVFPIAIFVVIAFWGIYAIDRELVYPAEIDQYIPQYLNHMWHTTIGIAVFIEMFLVFHRYPTSANAIAMIFIYSTGYIVWVVTILTVSNFWVYPFLQVMPPPVVSIFFAACFFVCLGLYFLGKQLAYWRWRERHQIIEELKL